MELKLDFYLKQSRSFVSSIGDRIPGCVFGFTGALFIGLQVLP